jgi:hypothetical protein
MTTIPAVIAALVSLGEATLDGDEWQTIDGPANTVTTIKDRVFAVAAEEIVSPTDYDSLGGSQSERYMVPLIISVSLPGPDTLAAARVAALAAHDDLREAIVNADPRNLGLGSEGVVDVYPTPERRVQQFANENGRSVAIRWGVDVYASLA